MTVKFSEKGLLEESLNLGQKTAIRDKISDDFEDELSASMDSDELLDELDQAASKLRETTA